MEEKLNISSILKDKPKNTKLYSPMFGECFLDRIVKSNEEIWVRYKNSLHVFDKYGRACSNGECMLFPSKDMRDWEKFSWRKGSVVVNGCGYTLLFDKWSNDIYTKFDAKYSNSREGYLEDKNLRTNNFTEVDCYAAYAYITEIERKLKGNLNLKTLEIEHPKSEFKDGDIVALVVHKCTHIAIFQLRQETYIGFHAVLCQNDKLLLEEPFREDNEDLELRPATDSEKQQLFDALAKEGKQWDAEKKAIVDLPKKYEFKTLDYVLIKTKEFNGRWLLAQYSFADSKNVSFVGGLIYCIDEVSIIPYNDSTKHLLGTTDEWKGGKG